MGNDYIGILFLAWLTCQRLERSFSAAPASACCRLQGSISTVQQKGKRHIPRKYVSFCTIDSYIFPRATPLEVEQDVKNNLGEVKKKKKKAVPGIYKKVGQEARKTEGRHSMSSDHHSPGQHRLLSSRFQCSSWQLKEKTRF